jgi:hypothetical protein
MYFCKLIKPNNNIINMTIEISKRSIIKAVVLAAILGVALFGGYSLGYDSGYSTGVDETTNKYENPKGDGEHFYAEEFTESRGSVNGIPINRSHMIYHSSPNCKAIENGVAMDRAFTDSTYRMSNSKFCPKCMDTNLIRKCERFLSQDFE